MAAGSIPPKETSPLAIFCEPGGMGTADRSENHHPDCETSGQGVRTLPTGRDCETVRMGRDNKAPD